MYIFIHYLSPLLEYNLHKDRNFILLVDVGIR